MVFSQPIVDSGSNFSKPTKEIVLTVSGLIDRTNVNDKALFDIDLLEQFTTIDIITNTIWLDGPTKFTGASLKQIMDFVGASGSTIIASAQNDYSVEIPMTAITADNAPILAYKMNDRFMGIRDKGPIWIIFPYDEDPNRYKNEITYSQSVWQLIAMEVQ